MEIPVYLFTGFLEAGKTTFIQKTLEDARFHQGENTLLLLCEEGMEEYNPDTFAAPHVFQELVENIEDLTPSNLDRWCKKHACERVMVEYNGMWSLDNFYTNMPEEWVVYQEFMFIDARSFFSYHNNIRELMLDKLKSCEMCVLNRAPDDMDEMQVHKIVRSVNRRCDIAYEKADGTVRYDEIPDELPFDIHAPVIAVPLDAYADFYRDMSEDMEKYEGKTVQLEGSVVLRKDLPSNCFIFGRQLMTCCADDMTFAGVICVMKDDSANLAHGDWVEVRANIALQKNKIYGRRGPILKVVALEKKTAPENPVAGFY